MFRAFVIAAPMVVASLSVSVAAPAMAAAAGQDNNAQCATAGQREQRRARGRAIGGMLGGMAGMLGGGAGSAASVISSALPVSELLGEAIASMLDNCEQQKAAAATEEALRGGDVGDSASWQSDTRPGVTGTSTITAVEANAPDGDCMTVTDVVIVDGEETRAPKRMCRRPPSTRYVRV
jgi:surface antigen